MQVSELELRLTPADLEPLLQRFWPDSAPVRAGAVRVEGDALFADLSVNRLGVTLGATVAARITDVTPESVVVSLSIPRLAALPKDLQDWLLGYLGRQIPAGVGSVTGSVLHLHGSAVLQNLPLSGELAGAGIAGGALWFRFQNVRYDLARAAEPNGLWAQDVHIAPAETAPAETTPASGATSAKPPVSIGEAAPSGYEGLRQRIQAFLNGRLPDSLRPAVPWLLALPDLFILLYRLTRDARVPTRAKLVAGAAAAYILMPLDIVPDWIPGAGLVDDLALALLALESMLTFTPPEALAEHWPGRSDILRFVREGLDFVADFLPTPLIARLRRWLQVKEGGSNG